MRRCRGVGAAAVGGFAVVLLAVSGAANLASMSISQTVVQLLAPDRDRGRVLGLYGVSANGLRLGSGFTVGLLGAWIGLTASLAWSAAALCLGTVVAGLVVWAARDGRPWTAPSVGLVAGGALGNVADRLRHGAVTDFLDFHAAGHHWPAFNLADAAIVAGVALLVAAGGRGGPAPAPNPAARS